MSDPGQRGQIDVKFVPEVCIVGQEKGTKWYQYTFIDEYSRFRYLEAFEEHSTYSSAVFLRHVIEKFPYAIECILSHNGFEFTNRLNSSGTKKQTLFERTLKELGIEHKLIRPFTPRHNGKVERSHRKDNEEFYASHKFYSFDDFKRLLALRQRQYNNFPMPPLICNISLTNLQLFKFFDRARNISSFGALSRVIFRKSIKATVSRPQSDVVGVYQIFSYQSALTLSFCPHPAVLLASRPGQNVCAAPAL